MEQQRTRQRTQDPVGGGDAPAAPGGASLMQQARGYGNVARQSRENCQQGHAAEQELHKRRNRSGE
jgi:hypothetical protein